MLSGEPGPAGFFGPSGGQARFGAHNSASAGNAYCGSSRSCAPRTSTQKLGPLHASKMQMMLIGVASTSGVKQMRPRMRGS